MPDATSAPQPVEKAALRWTTAELTVLGCSLLSLAICCVLTSSKKYFEFDELFSWTFVTDPSLRHMLDALYHGADGAPPLYHITMRAWTGIFGSSEFAFRSASCLAFMAALAITWATLRRAFGRWPAAVASLFVLGLSSLTLHQVAQARFYGLLTVLVATAIYLYTRAVSGNTISGRLLLAIWLTHVALAYTHFYGLFYSGAILVAWVINDRLSGRAWHRGYFAIFLAWAAFLPWLPAVRAVADVARPYNTNPVPTIGNLVRAYGFSLHGTALVLASVFVLGALTLPSLPVGVSPPQSRPGYMRRWRATRLGLAVLLTIYGAYGIHNPVIHLPGAKVISRALPLPGHPGLILILLASVVFWRVAARFSRTALNARESSRPISSGDSLLLVGLSVLSVPILSFVVSHIGPSSFKPRYFIPASLGLAPAIAYLICWSSQGGLIKPAWDKKRDAHLPGSIVAAGWVLLALLIAAVPALVGLRAPAQHRPGIEVEALAPANATVVVESEGELLPVRHYQQRRDLTYVYPMDWAAASRAVEVADAAAGYKEMAIWGRFGYMDSTTLGGTRVPCSKTQFVVLNSRHAWFDMRVVPDSTLTEQRIGVSHATPSPSVIFLVRRRSTGIPAMCRDRDRTGLTSHASGSTNQF